MKATPHLLIAAALAAITLLATASSLLGGSGGYPIPVRELRVSGFSAGSAEPFPADRAIAPLVPELSASPSSNPFSARKASSLVDIRIPPPPPPRLDPPALPVMPVPVP